MGPRMSPRDVESRWQSASMLEQKVTKITKGRAGSKAEEDRGGESGAFRLRLAGLVRGAKMKTAEALRNSVILGFGFGCSVLGDHCWI